MSNAIGDAKDLNTSRAEALHGLLSSLGHSNDGQRSSAVTSPSSEQIQRLSAKITEILGHGVDYDPTLGNQPTQLLNEEGLPIIDISENFDEGSQMHTSPTLVREQDLVPLSLLPPDERDRRRRERDRILDLLEEEERLQQVREERDAEKERKEAISKRKESAKAELDRLKAVRDLQKRMGQALIQHAEQIEGKKQEGGVCVASHIMSTTAKKSALFPNTPAVNVEEGDRQVSIHQSDWGDVTPGRLRAQSRIPLVSTAEVEKYPMKMHVVERRLAAEPSSPIHTRGVDSDDESISSAGQLSSHTADNSAEEKDGSTSSEDYLSDREPLDEEFDYDAAQHHREIALEYHRKRHDIGAETAKAMGALALENHEEYDASNEQVPLSRFRADKMTAAYDKSYIPDSTSVGQITIPASRQKSLRNSVRLGKLENEQLVGGPAGESGSEDETVRKVIQMVKTGGIHNAGPHFDPYTLAPTFIATETPSADTSNVAPTLKPSKFRLARGGASTEATTLPANNSRDNNQPQSAISSVVERKAPPKQHFPIRKPSRRPPTAMPTSSTIIDSPSFPKPAGTSIVGISSPPQYKPLASSSPSPLSRPSMVKSPVAQDSISESQASPRDQSTASEDRYMSKFMAK